MPVSPELRKRIVDVLEEIEKQPELEFALINHTHDLIGPEGKKGDRGECGARGQPGIPGERGARGEQGLIGMHGDRGEKGEHGFQGIPGKNGLQGDRGDPGAQGLRGERGLPGAKGDPGEIKVYVVYTSNPKWADEIRIHPEIIRLVNEKEKELSL